MTMLRKPPTLVVLQLTGGPFLAELPEPRPYSVV